MPAVRGVSAAAAGSSAREKSIFTRDQRLAHVGGLDFRALDQHAERLLCPWLPSKVQAGISLEAQGAEALRVPENPGQRNTELLRLAQDRGLCH